MYMCRLPVQVTGAGYMRMLHMQFTYAGFLWEQVAQQVTHAVHMCRLHVQITRAGYMCWFHMQITCTSYPCRFHMWIQVYQRTDMQVANGLLPVSVAVLQPESNSSLPTGHAIRK